VYRHRGPKGFGSENMSRLGMLKPADGVDGVKKFVVETVKLAGPNPCPPIVLGIGPQGFGPQGFGGKTTCLGLSIEAAPTHVASLPVAVNVSCHVTRRATCIL